MAIETTHAEFYLVGGGGGGGEASLPKNLQIVCPECTRMDPQLSKILNFLDEHTHRPP